MYISVLLLQCNDEDSNVGPSGEDKNWYIVYPSDDPLDRLIYEVYENHHGSRSSTMIRSGERRRLIDSDKSGCLMKFWTRITRSKV